MLPERRWANASDREGTMWRLASTFHRAWLKGIAYEKAALTLYRGRTAKWCNVGAHPIQSISFDKDQSHIVNTATRPSLDVRHPVA